MAEITDIVFARALYSFEALRRDQLSFLEGDIITILHQDDSGWWKGSDSTGKIGLFPHNYVELSIDVKDEYPICRALYDFDGPNEGDLPFVEGDELVVIKMLSDDWWKGRMKNDGSKQGIFPCAFVELTGEYDVETADEEARKWREVEEAARAEASRAQAKIVEAEKEMELQRLKLEEATRLAAEARAALEKEKMEARTAKAIEEQEKLRKAQVDLAKKREEAEKEHEKARENFKSVRLEQSAANAKVAAAEKKAIETEKKKQAEESLGQLPEGPAGSKAGGYMARRKVNYAKASENEKYSKLGGGDTCRKCSKGVGVMEKMLGPGGHVYHKDCFTCSTCNKRLNAGEYSENKENPYCKECYGKAFGIKGFGFGGAVATVAAASSSGPATPAVESTSVFANVGAGADRTKTYSMRLKEMKELAAKKP